MGEKEYKWEGRNISGREGIEVGREEYKWERRSLGGREGIEEI